MIIKNGKTISSIYKGNKAIEKIYKGTLVLYEGWTIVTKSGMPPLSLKSSGADLIKYTMYGNSLQNGVPTPSNPIEIVSVGEKTKNLFDLSILENESNYTEEALYLIDDNEVIVNRSNTIGWANLQTLNLKPNTKYCMSVDNLTNIDIRTPENVKLYPQTETTTATFTTDSTGLVCFKMFSPANTYPHKIGHLQLEEGDNSTQYEPYGYKIPIKVRGKNLHNGSTDVFGSYINGNGVLVADNSSSYTQLIPVKSNTIYGFSCQTNTGISAVQNKRLHAYDKDGNWIQQLCYLNYQIGEKGYKYAVCTTPSNCSFVRISHIARFEDFIQLEEEQVTEYEPYVEPIKTNIYLDEPLRKIGDYADYIKFLDKNESRRIEEDIYDGTERWQVIGIEGEASSYYVLSKGEYGSLVASAGLSTHFERTSVTSSNYNIGFNIINSSGYNEARICIRPDITKYSTLKLWKDFLAKQYENGTPVKVYYVLTTSIEETIELPNIPTIKGTTIIEVDTEVQPSNLEITYKGKN